MKKFLNVLLKVILTLSFAGIIVTITFVIINNQSIAYEAYNHITTESSKYNMSALRAKVNKNIRQQYGAEEFSNPYVQVISTGLSKLELGIDYYLDYLSIEYDLSKGEQDNLINKFDKYISYYNSIDESITVYLGKYNEAASSDYAKTQVVLLEKEIVNKYLDCYNSGSDFFKDLVNIVNKHCYNSSHNFSFDAQIHLIKNGICDYFIEDVFYENGQLAEQRLPENDFSRAQRYGRFQLFCVAKGLETTITDNSLIVNTKFNQLVNNLNSLNIYEFAGNYKNYHDSAKGEMQTKIARTNELFEEIF